MAEERRWRAVRTKADRMCHWCCEDVYRFGQNMVPAPRMARWRVTDGDVVERLCEGHKVKRCNGG